MSGQHTYRVRRNAFETERTWMVDASGLSWSATDKSGHFDFKDITSIRLEWTGSRFDHARYACHVRRFNGWTETIVSTHYDGPAQFADRAEGYRAFVAALVRQTAAANPSCAFHAGSGILHYAFNVAFMAASLALLALVMFTIGIPLHWLILTKLLVIAFLLPLALRWVKKNRPRRFEASAIPADVLPAIAAA